MSNSSRCAACKSLRRRCPQDCVLAPYFPSNNPQRFSWVHKIFGSSNITKMLQQLPVHLRGDAADCMALEAYSRIEDPVYGCVGIISQLQQQIIETQSEIVKVKGDIAFYNAQLLQQQQFNKQHQQMHDEYPPREPSRLSSNITHQDSTHYYYQTNGTNNNYIPTYFSDFSL